MEWLQIHTDQFRAGSPMRNGSEGHVSSVLCREGVLGEGLLHQGGEENEENVDLEHLAWMLEAVANCHQLFTGKISTSMFLPGARLLWKPVFENGALAMLRASPLICAQMP